MVRNSTAVLLDGNPLKSPTSAHTNLRQEKKALLTPMYTNQDDPQISVNSRQDERKVNDFIRKDESKGVYGIDSFSPTKTTGFKFYQNTEIKEPIGSQKSSIMINNAIQPTLAIQKDKRRIKYQAGKKE